MTTDTAKPKRSARKKKAKKVKKKAKKTSVKKDQRKEVKKAVKQDSGGTLAERLTRAEELLALHPRAEPLYRLTAQLLNAAGRPLEAEARLQENLRL